MNTTSGVGLVDFAFQRSSMLRSCGPYFTSARSGFVFGAVFCFEADCLGACATASGRPSDNDSSVARKSRVIFMTIRGCNSAGVRKPAVQFNGESTRMDADAEEILLMSIYEMTIW